MDKRSRSFEIDRSKKTLGSERRHLSPPGMQHLWVAGQKSPNLKPPKSPVMTRLMPHGDLRRQAEVDSCRSACTSPIHLDVRSKSSDSQTTSSLGRKHLILHNLHSSWSSSLCIASSKRSVSPEPTIKNI